MAEIKNKVEEKRLIKSNFLVKINQATAELDKVKNAIVMAEDKFEEIELKKKRYALEQELESIEDYFGLDVEAFAKKLINNPDVLALEAEAKAERIANREVLTTYEQALRKHLDQSRKEFNRFTASHRSD